MTSTRWHDLRLRVLSALVLAPIGLACLVLGGPAWIVLLALCSFGIGLEWAGMWGQKPGTRLALALGAAPVAALGVLAAGFPGPALLLLVPWVLALIVLARATRFPPCRWPGMAAADLGPVGLALGVVYVGPAALALAWLRADLRVGLANLLFLLLVVWANDIGAYAAGRLLGGPKLAPMISPGKTWSGTLGGLVAGMATGVGVAMVSDAGSAVAAAVVALLIGAAGQVGDLLESGVKRWTGVKDSGRLIPGHGGLADRLDAVLAAALVAALIVWWRGRGVVLWM